MANDILLEWAAQQSSDLSQSRVLQKVSTRFIQEEPSPTPSTNVAFNAATQAKQTGPTDSALYAPPRLADFVSWKPGLREKGARRGKGDSTRFCALQPLCKAASRPLLWSSSFYELALTNRTTPRYQLRCAQRSDAQYSRVWRSRH
jgi:hypothetical protein